MSPYENGGAHVIINVIRLVKTHDLKTRSSPSLQTRRTKVTHIFTMRSLRVYVNSVLQKGTKTTQSSTHTVGRGRSPSLLRRAMLTTHVYGVNHGVVSIFKSDQTLKTEMTLFLFCFFAFDFSSWRQRGENNENLQIPDRDRETEKTRRVLTQRDGRNDRFRWTIFFFFFFFGFSFVWGIRWSEFSIL